MRASTKRILSILLSGVFLIAIIVVSTTLIKPAFDDTTRKRALLYSKENLLQNQQSAVTEVQNLIDQFQGFDALQNTITLAMPTEENSTEMLNQLTAIARNSNTQILSFSSEQNAFEGSGQSLAKRLGSMNVEVSAAGQYDDVREFVQLLETNVRVFNVEKLSLSPYSDATGGDIISATVVFDAYYQSN